MKRLLWILLCNTYRIKDPSYRGEYGLCGLARELVGDEIITHEEKLWLIDYIIYNRPKWGFRVSSKESSYYWTFGKKWPRRWWLIGQILKWW